MATHVTECVISLKLDGGVPEEDLPEVQRIMDEICEHEGARVRKVFELALAAHFGAGVLGDQSDA
jgi:hypothetical protein